MQEFKRIFVFFHTIITQVKFININELECIIVNFTLF